MTIQTDTFDPDTCPCSVVFSWDDTIDPPVYSVVNFLNKCVFHSILSDSNALAILMDEDVRKNTVLQACIDNLAADLSSTGVAGGTLKSGITYQFTLTGTAPNRVLNISFTGITLTANQKLTAQNWCDTHIGVGKVLIL